MVVYSQYTLNGILTHLCAYDKRFYIDKGFTKESDLHATRFTLCKFQ